MQFRNAHFFKSAASEKDFPILRDLSGNLLKEMAVIGRSNVGKSSLINHLLQTKNLAKTSSTPGKTQLINFFTVDNSFAVVDLPGYGYAKISDSMRKNWGEVIKAYLEERSNLNLLLFLMDVRRTPNEDDAIILDWILKQGCKVILVLTKIDKIPITQRQKQIKTLLNTLPPLTIPYVLYSATKNIGRDDLIAKIKEALK